MSLDKFRGCLVGGAAGDALGYEIEFWGNSRIFSYYGPQGIQEYELYADDTAIFSDDTQMTLATAVGLLNEAAKAGEDKKYQMLPMYGIWEAYSEWYQMQRFGKAKKRKTWLYDVPEMAASRAPGMACMTSLGNQVPGNVEEPINNSKGCGGVMRVAPVGLFFNRTPEKEDRIEEVNHMAAGAAALTHGHPLGYMTAASLAHIVNRIVFGGCAYGESLEDIMQESMFYLRKLYPETAHTEMLCELIEKAMKLTQNEESDLENITELGEGWVAEETLAIAVYCALKYQDDFSKAICAAVNHKGDSDSTGAVTGNILGAWIGFENMPDKWKEHLERKDVILEVVEDLYYSGEVLEKGNIEAAPLNENWRKKYLEHKAI